MNTLHRLDALHGENPLGFLAAVGTLVLLSREKRGPAPRLAWEAEPPHAALLEAGPATREALADELFAALTAPDAPTPRRAIGPRKLSELTVTQYREQIAQLDELTAGLLAGICSDVTAEENAERGPLVMTGGPQDFPRDMAKPLATVAKAGPPSVADALFGPWEYVDGHPLGFDPLMEKRHAYLAIKPESRNAEHVPGALLLAVAALAALPLFPTNSRKGFTSVLFKDGRWERMLWPLWTILLPLAQVRSVLAVVSPNSRWPGLVAVYTSERGVVGSERGRYYVLRPGRRLW